MIPLVDALRFDEARLEGLTGLTAEGWRRTLSLADREHLTLELGLRAGSCLPGDVGERIQRNLEDNARRYERARQTYCEIAARLEQRNVEFVVLKGFSHWPCYTLNPRHRPQYDLDLLCGPDHLQRARGALESLGYAAAPGREKLPVDHLPTMLRWRDWRWKGDYFDPDMPLAVELHFRLWDEATERIQVSGLEQFWERRTLRWVEEFCIPALDRVDTIAYAALHMMRHLLRGDARLRHAYEIGRFLHHTADDEGCWQRWRTLQTESARRLQTIAFLLAKEWYGCQLPPVVEEQAGKLPERVQHWFRVFAMAPVEAKLRPNKSEVWLHLNLLDSVPDKAAVLGRRLFPLRRQRSAAATLSRAAHHTRALASMVGDAWAWWRPAAGLDRQFLRFLASAAFFNFGLTVFFLLYNLHLIQRGFREEFVGAVASAMSLGSIAGALLAPFALQRLGLRKTLVLTFLGVPLVSMVRATAEPPAVLVAAAAAGGFLFSFYAVSLAPAVAHLTNERSRRLGFSVVFAAGIGIGIFATFLGGRLPGLLTLQGALLAGCGLAGLGALLASGVRFGEPPAAERRVYPANRFVWRFLGALMIWHLATGACNPFFNVYFGRELQTPVEEIGTLFSAAHAAQVAALLLAPAALRRFGFVSGVAGMQIATAAALGALALAPGGFFAGAAYAAYMSFQYMSEPGMYSLLMERVSPRERYGASAMNFVVMFGGQAIAAAVAGFAVRHYGYRIVLTLAGLTALLAGVALRTLIRDGSPGHSTTSHTSRWNLSSVKRAS